MHLHLYDRLVRPTILNTIRIISIWSLLSGIGQAASAPQPGTYWGRDEKQRDCSILVRVSENGETFGSISFSGTRYSLVPTRDEGTWGSWFADKWMQKREQLFLYLAREGAEEGTPLSYRFFDRFGSSAVTVREHVCLGLSWVAP